MKPTLKEQLSNLSKARELEQNPLKAAMDAQDDVAKYMPGEIRSPEIDGENIRRGLSIGDETRGGLPPKFVLKENVRKRISGDVNSLLYETKDDPLADIFKPLNERNRHEKLALPDNVDVEQTLIDGGAYKLGTGPHHVTHTNLPITNLRDVKPAKHLRTDIAIDQELAERIANTNTDETYDLRRKELTAWIPDGVLFKIQNVRDYYMAHANEHNWYDPETFFGVKLPFDRIAFSYDHDFKLPGQKDFTRRHVNVIMESVTVAQFHHFIGRVDGPRMSAKDSADILHIVDRRQPDSLIKTHIAFDGISVPGIWLVMLDETGHVLVDDVHNLKWLWIRDPAETEHLARVEAKLGVSEEDIDVFARHGTICLTALQFMNCRNVEILENPPTRQQRRQAEREGKKAPVTYKTLVIHPVGKKRQVTRSADGTVNPGVSLHIVRGHFKNYMAGAGLGRGHTHGVYWWSPMVRGSAEHGRVEKDYAVKP